MLKLTKKFFSKIDNFLDVNNIEKREVLLVSDMNIWEKIIIYFQKILKITLEIF